MDGMVDTELQLILPLRCTGTDPPTPSIVRTIASANQINRQHRTPIKHLLISIT